MKPLLIFGAMVGLLLLTACGNPYLETDKAKQCGQWLCEQKGKSGSENYGLVLGNIGEEEQKYVFDLCGIPPILDFGNKQIVATNQDDFISWCDAEWEKRNPQPKQESPADQAHECITFHTFTNTTICGEFDMKYLYQYWWCITILPTTQSETNCYLREPPHTINQINDSDEAVLHKWLLRLLQYNTSLTDHCASHPEDRERCECDEWIADQITPNSERSLRVPVVIIAPMPSRR